VNAVKPEYSVTFGAGLVLYLSTVCSRARFFMSIDEMKAKLMALLNQRDMLSQDRDSMELDDLLQGIDAESRELHRKIWKTA
jgi:hypothetical protein